MLPSGLRVEVLRDWEAAGELRQEWWALQQQADTPSPFCSFEWFDAWYRAYCSPENVRVIVVRDESRLRALLPGVREKRRYKGISLSCFAFATEWGTPRCGVIALPGDMEAARAAIMAVVAADAPTHLVILPNVESDSLTWKVLISSLEKPWKLQTESIYESPVYSMPTGWDEYLATRSRDFRRILRQSASRGEKRGGITSKVFVTGRDFEEGLERLRALEPRTWQGDIRNGVLRHDMDAAFYKHLSAAQPSSLRLEIEFLQIGGVDTAFMLMAIIGNDVFLLRTGFDADYEYCRPGLIIRERIGRRLAAEGIIHFDLGAGVYEVKRKWETHRRIAGCFWLINCSTLKGRTLQLELFLLKLLKPLLRRFRTASTESLPVTIGGSKDVVST